MRSGRFIAVTGADHFGHVVRVLAEFRSVLNQIRIIVVVFTVFILDAERLQRFVVAGLRLLLILGRRR